MNTTVETVPVTTDRQSEIIAKHQEAIRAQLGDWVRALNATDPVVTLCAFYITADGVLHRFAHGAIEPYTARMGIAALSEAVEVMLREKGYIVQSSPLYIPVTPITRSGERA